MISGAVEMNGRTAGNGTAYNLASAFLILAVLAYGAAAYQRNQIWKTGLSMAEDNIRKTPMNPRARLNLGMAYKDLDMLNKAKEEFKAAVFLAPRYADAHNNLANVFLVEGRPVEARAEYKEVLRLRPAHAEAHYNIAIVSLQLGLDDEALKHFQIFVKLAPPAYQQVVEETKVKIEELKATRPDKER